MRSVPGAVGNTAALAIRKARRAELLRWATRHVAVLAAAAACIAVGWFGRGIVTGRHAADSDARGRSATALNTSALSGAVPATHTGGTYRVALTDTAGNVLAVQTFARPDEAQRFATDLAQWQAAQQQSRQGQVRTVSDEF